MTDSRSGSRSFDSKLISLLPLDEVPVHVHRFAARVPCDSKGSECQCGIHTAETSTSSRSLNSNSSAAITFFAWHPNSPPRPGEAPHPAPSARKSATRTAQKTALCAPCELPGGSESGNPQHLSAQTTPRVRGRLAALLVAMFVPLRS